MILHANEVAVQDMHPEDIKAEIKKAGYTMTQLANKHGIRHGSTLNQVFINPNYPKAERIISQAIGVPVDQIWPSRAFNRAKRAPK